MNLIVLNWILKIIWRLVNINLTLRGLNIILRKVVYFTSRDVDSQNFGQKSGFKRTSYFHDPSSGSSGRVRGGGGRETWNLCGRLWQSSFYGLFSQGRGGHGPLGPPGSATGSTKYVQKIICYKWRQMFVKVKRQTIWMIVWKINYCF